MAKAIAWDHPILLGTDAQLAVSTWTRHPALISIPSLNPHPPQPHCSLPPWAVSPTHTVGGRPSETRGLLHSVPQRQGLGWEMNAGTLPFSKKKKNSLIVYILNIDVLTVRRGVELTCWLICLCYCCGLRIMILFSLRSP